MDLVLRPMWRIILEYFTDGTAPDPNGSWNKWTNIVVGGSTALGGRSISLSSDGSIVAVGAYGEDSQATNGGVVAVYQRNVTNTTVLPHGWSQLGSNIYGALDEWLGSCVALNADGTVLAICGNQILQIYKYNGSTWNNEHSQLVSTLTSSSLYH